MSDLTPEIVTALLNAGRLGMGPQAVPAGNTPYVLVPEGAMARAMPELVWNEHNPAPERVRQKVTVLDTGSFNHYYTLFNDPNSRVFADESTLKVLAVLDYHGAAEGGPRWGSHRLTLSFRQSEEWKVWIGANNKKMTQQEFAEFLEQNSLDVTKPAPADMMEIASDLQATTAVDFGSGLRQQDGQVKFKYTETINTTVGGGQVSVPERFTISIPAFIGGDRVPMDALLRFRVNSGKLTFWYTLVRPEEVIRSAFIDARTFIGTTLGITIINGSPD